MNKNVAHDILYSFAFHLEHYRLHYATKNPFIANIANININVSGRDGKVNQSPSFKQDRTVVLQV